jgi:hypothetical protein
MCGGVLYTYKGQEVRVYFPNPKAALPVRTRYGDMAIVIWGRRKEEQGVLPPGGWARLDSIQAGRWDKYFPVPVKIAASSFMEKDKAGKSHWFDLTRSQWIQGLVARDAGEERVYVVTIKPQLPDAVHDRWPRIVIG